MVRTTFEARLPELVRMRALADGERDRAWMRRLDDLVAALEHEWSIVTGDVFAGGSESLVVAAECEDGRRAILKLGLPGTSDLATEATVLRLAAGRGYAGMLDHDAARNALLMERLGSTLQATEPSPAEQWRVICRTLSDAWLPLDETHGLMTGAGKCAWLREFISEQFRLQDGPCPARVVRRALDYAERREAAHDPANCVLVHGDAHANNLLAAGDGSWRFVDPDGLFAERACDLAAPMREGNDELMAGDAARLAVERCEWLASLTGVAPAPVWQWGFIERVSTGLALRMIGSTAEGDETLSVADRIVAVTDYD